MMVSQKIGSYAILDIETTGLPAFNFFKTNITEISISAISKSSIKNAENCNTPRAVQKLTMLFNPMMRIDATATELSGLDNNLLESESKFDEKSADVIIAFFERLQQPVCLVAHNGYNFDFPIIKKSLEKINKELPKDIVCIDSLPAIQDMDSKIEISELLKFNNYSDLDLLEEDQKVFKEEHISDIQAVLNSENAIDWQKINENTPKRKKSDGQLIRQAPNLKLCRKLFPGTSPKSVSNNSKKPYGHYKLGTIYERIFKEKPMEAHRAEADVEYLQKILLHYGHHFTEYSEKYSIEFSNISLKKFQNYLSN